MTENAVRDFVEEYFEDFLAEVCNHNVFKEMEVDDMDELDYLTSTNSFKDTYDMVVENSIDIHNDYYLCLVDDRLYGYPSSEDIIKNKYVDVITSQLLDKAYTEWDDVAKYNHIGDDEMCLKKIREEVLRPKKFRVNLIAVLEGIDIEADDYAEAYDKAISMLSTIGGEVPIKNIVQHISGAEMYDDDGNFKGGISNCMDELK